MGQFGKIGRIEVYDCVASQFSTFTGLWCSILPQKLPISPIQPLPKLPKLRRTLLEVSFIASLLSRGLISGQVPGNDPIDALLFHLKIFFQAFCEFGQMGGTVEDGDFLFAVIQFPA